MPKKYTGISYSSLLFYFSSGLAVAVEEQSLCAPDLLYSKPSSESAVLNESADTTSLFLRSDRAYTDVYIKLESLPQLSGDIDVIRRGYAWYNGLSQSQRDQQPSYLQYLCNVIDHCRVGAASQDQLDPLPIYVRITTNTEAALPVLFCTQQWGNHRCSSFTLCDCLIPPAHNGHLQLSDSSD